MSWKSAYESEILKQTEPYLYYLQTMKNEERGKSINVDGPLPCVINIKGIDASAYECEIPGNKLLEDAVSVSYVIIKTSKVTEYEDGVSRLLEAAVGKGQNNEKLIPDLIYCDNDHKDSNGVRHTPYFKPDHSPHTLLGSNYMGEMIAVRKELILDVLSDDKESLWSQAVSLSGSGKCPEEDMQSLVFWALLLDIAKRCNSITHVTETLYSILSDDISQKIYDDYSQLFSKDAADLIRKNALKKYGIVKKDYSLSVIIPSKDHSEILTRCLESIKIKTGFNQNNKCEIIIIDNGSSEEERLKISQYISDNPKEDIRYIYEKSDFNYSAMCNKAASLAKGELLLFLNDDIEAVSPSFIDEMAVFALSDNVGAVGAKLLFPKGNLIQHAGITSLDCGPTHKYATYDDSVCYYFGVNRFYRNCLATTGACLMIAREKYFQVNGFHDKMKVSYNDVDLCVNLYEKGLFNVVLNDVKLVHHESLSRGSDLISEEKYSRLKSERDLFYERHDWLSKTGDPFYNNHLIQDSLDYRPNVVPDYEIRDKVSVVEVLSCKGKHKAFRDRLKFTVEDISVIPSFEDARIRFLELSGWSLFLKHDERMYDRYILLIPSDVDSKDDMSNAVKISVMPKFRTDVGEVFSEKYAKLSGFVSRIPESTLKEGVRHRVAILYIHKLLRIKTIAFGDYYEPGKGYGE